MIASLIAFIESPLGQILVQIVPTLFQDVIKIWHTSGVVTSEDIVNYIASQKSFDSLVPKKQ